MSTSADKAIQSGAQHVEETQHLAASLESPRDPSLAEVAEQDGPKDEMDGAPVKTTLADLTLSIFAQGASTRVRVGNAHNSSELYEAVFDSPDEANNALLDAGILTAEQVPDNSTLPAAPMTLASATVEQLEAAGLKRHGSSTL